MGDWDYINEHMGGHDEDGLPNFMNKPGFADENANSDEPDEFEPYEEIMTTEKALKRALFNLGKLDAKKSPNYEQDQAHFEEDE